MATPSDVLKLVKDEGVEIVDVRFCDLPGLMQHFSIPAHELTEDVFEDGLGFDGSSIRGFQEIQESDMLLIPDPNTAVHRPVPPAHDAQHQLLRAATRSPASRTRRDPRYIAQKAEDVPQAAPASPTPRTSGPKPSSTSSTRCASTRTSTRATTSSTRSRACGTRAASASSTARPNLGYKPRYKEGYFPVPPMDQFQDLRSEMVRHARGGRHRDRGAAPRGRHRRPGRDRHALRHARRRWPTS